MSQPSSAQDDREHVWKGLESWKSMLEYGIIDRLGSVFDDTLRLSKDQGVTFDLGNDLVHRLADAAESYKQNVIDSSDNMIDAVEANNFKQAWRRAKATLSLLTGQPVQADGEESKGSEGSEESKPADVSNVDGQEDLRDRIFTVHQIRNPTEGTRMIGSLKAFGDTYVDTAGRSWTTNAKPFDTVVYRGHHMGSQHDFQSLMRNQQLQGFSQPDGTFSMIYPSPRPGPPPSRPGPHGNSGVATQSQQQAMSLKPTGPIQSQATTHQGASRFGPVQPSVNSQPGSQVYSQFPVSGSGLPTNGMIYPGSQPGSFAPWANSAGPTHIHGHPGWVPSFGAPLGMGTTFTVQPHTAQAVY